MSENNWRWKDEDRQKNDALGLRYEPGNWGDLLKGLWVTRVMESLLERFRERPLRALDPFAGRATYALTEASAARLEGLHQVDAFSMFLSHLSSFVEEWRFPSTSRLAREVAHSSGRILELAVYDADRRSLATWEEVPETRRLDVIGAQAIFESGRVPAPDFLLVDPYDLFDHWKEPLARSLPFAASGVVLYYLYNKSTRGEGHREYYDAFRKSLDKQVEALEVGVSTVVGRVPSDAIAPRAEHEVILLGPDRLVEEIRADLESATSFLESMVRR